MFGIISVTRARSQCTNIGKKIKDIFPLRGRCPYCYYFNFQKILQGPSSFVWNLVWRKLEYWNVRCVALSYQYIINIDNHENATFFKLLIEGIVIIIAPFQAKVKNNFTQPSKPCRGECFNPYKKCLSWQTLPCSSKQQSQVVALYRLPLVNHRKGRNNCHWPWWPPRNFELNKKHQEKIYNLCCVGRWC